jgi:hypothetical protein
LMFVISAEPLPINIFFFLSRAIKILYPATMLSSLCHVFFILFIFLDDTRMCWLLSNFMMPKE